MPTKLKKTTKKKGNDKRPIFGVKNSEKKSDDNDLVKELDENPILGVEPILESPEFMNSIDQLREKLNSRSNLDINTIPLDKISGKKILKSRMALFVLGFLLGALMFYFLM